jgi:hypothetical protein
LDKLSGMSLLSALPFVALAMVGCQKDPGLESPMKDRSPTETEAAWPGRLEPVADWSRPLYESGGGDALVFYVIYGQFPKPFAPGPKYRLQDFPPGIRASKLIRADEPESHGALLSSTIGTLLFQKDPELVQAARNTPEALTLYGEVKDPRDLSYLRTIVGLITYLLDSGGVAVLDPQQPKLWRAEDWRKTVFEPDLPVPGAHVVVLGSQDEGDASRLWIHTRGLRTFGRADISIRNVPQDRREDATLLAQRLSEAQVFGLNVPEGREIRGEGLPAGMRCRHGGSLEDPDFNNIHIEVRWP